MIIIVVDVAVDATFSEVIFERIVATICIRRFKSKDKLNSSQKIFKNFAVLLHEMEGKLDFFEENCIRIHNSCISCNSRSKMRHSVSFNTNFHELR